MWKPPDCGDGFSRVQLPINERMAADESGFAKREGAAYIHPFDDPRIWTGHASMVEEIAAGLARNPEPRHPIIPWVVSDRAAVDACMRFADDHRILAEPACGAAHLSGTPKDLRDN